MSPALPVLRDDQRPHRCRVVREMCEVLRSDLYERHGCAWSLWENVEGALSSNEGADFATVLASHVGADVVVPAGGWPGAGVVIGPWGAAEWRLLDAQFFGVPQRRRRVFVVGHLGARVAPAVLADAASSERHPAQGSEAGPHAAARSTRSVDQARGVGAFNVHAAGSTVTGAHAYETNVARSLDRNGGFAAGQGGTIAHALTAEGFDASEDGTGRGTPLVAGTMPARGRTGGYDVDPSMAADGYLVAATLTSGQSSEGIRPPGRRQEDDTNIVAFSENQRGEIIEADRAQALSSGGGKPGQGYAAARIGNAVRRLTPTECERLMGWPDGWTYSDGPSLLDGTRDTRSDIPPDGRRYAACGDGVVANVAEWIGLKLITETEAVPHAA